MHEFPVFTLAEANDALPEVIRLTVVAVSRLTEIDEVWGKLPFKKFDAVQGAAAEDLIRAEWARRIAALGVQPKGYYVADFQSPDPDTVYCWGYPEGEVSHEHKSWETFFERRPVRDAHRFECGPGSPSHESPSAACDDESPREE